MLGSVQLAHACAPMAMLTLPMLLKAEGSLGAASRTALCHMRCLCKKEIPGKSGMPVRHHVRAAVRRNDCAVQTASGMALVAGCVAAPHL